MNFEGEGREEGGLIIECIFPVYEQRTFNFCRGGGGVEGLKSGS